MTDTQTITDLLRALASRIVERPDSLEIKSKDFSDGSTHWAMHSAPEDEAKLIGKRGVRVQALAFLVGEMGKAVGKPYHFRLVTSPTVAPMRWDFPNETRDYDPEPLREILVGILGLMDLDEFKVEVAYRYGFFVFTITCRDAADTPKLMVDNPEQFVRIDSAIGSALFTLLKAIGKMAGVKFGWVVK